MGFVKPERKILTMQDMGNWMKSKAYSDYLGFVLALNKAAQKRLMTDPFEESEVVKKLLEMLEKIVKLIDETPPHVEPEGPQRMSCCGRFGNLAYREWHAKLASNAEPYLKEVLGDSHKDAVIELTPYFLESFGNAQRIDYGTGHEACFTMLLFCLFKLELLKEDHTAVVVLRVFNRYLEVCRKLQIDYRMEPAGTHGVWSLDDFQFLPFVWGSSQLIDNPRLAPDCYVKPDFIPHVYSKDYLFFGCIEFINNVKTGPFHEHSNQLYNISGVPTWTKMNSGLIKMYEGEVLKKFPVVQHFVFGTLLSFDPK